VFFRENPTGQRTEEFSSGATIGTANRASHSIMAGGDYHVDPTSQEAPRNNHNKGESLSLFGQSLWRRPIVKVLIEGQEVEVLLDTGADDTIIQVGEIELEGVPHQKTVGGLAGYIQVQSYSAIEIQWENKRARDTVLIGPTPINILGRNFLAKFSVTLNMVSSDIPITKVKLKEGKEPPKIKQWPLTREKIEGLQIIIDDMVKAGQLEEVGPENPYNSPVFAIRKKDKTQWRMLIDFRALNQATQDFAEVQQGIPHPSGLPQMKQITVLDMKDAYYSIPLDPDFSQYTAFTIPSLNNDRPGRRYQFKVLPQGWKGSPTIFQHTSDQLLRKFRDKYPQVALFQYMDDLLVGSNESLEEHRRIVGELRALLNKVGIQTPEAKYQDKPPIKWLGYELYPDKWKVQPIELPDKLTWTVNELQKLIGKLNWACQIYSGIKTKALCRYLRGVKGLLEEVQLSEEAEAELAENREILAEETHGTYYQEGEPLEAELTKLAEGQWGYMIKQGKRLLKTGKFAKQRTAHSNPYQQLIGAMQKIGKESIVFWGQVPVFRIPVVKEEWEQWWTEHWQCSWIPTIVPIHTPPLVRLWYNLVQEPIEGADTYYVDGAAHRESKEGKAGYVTATGKEHVIKLEKTTNQKAELEAVLLALKDSGPKVNIVTDSQYVYGILAGSPTETDNKIIEDIIQLLLSKEAVYLAWLPAHKGIGGNEQVDKLVSQGIRKILFVEQIPEAQEEHERYHNNWRDLKARFKLPTIVAKAIIEACPKCQVQGEPKTGQNNAAVGTWQMDCTHLEGQIICVAVHVASGYIETKILPRETGRETALFLLQVASRWPISHLHTDNGPNFVSAEMQAMVWWLKIEHSAGVPYNPQSQGAVENKNKQLKKTITQIRDEVQYLSTAVAQATFILNYKRRGGLGDMCPAEAIINMIYTELQTTQLQNQIQNFSDFKVYYRKGANPLWQGPAHLIWKGEGAVVLRTDEGEVITVPRRKAKIIKPYGQALGNKIDLESSKEQDAEMGRDN
ncbi:pol protein, partial [Simian immunodeficiency virus]